MKGPSALKNLSVDLVTGAVSMLTPSADLKLPLFGAMSLDKPKAPKVCIEAGWMHCDQTQADPDQPNKSKKIVFYMSGQGFDKIADDHASPGFLLPLDKADKKKDGSASLGLILVQMPCEVTIKDMYGADVTINIFKSHLAVSARCSYFLAAP